MIMCLVNHWLFIIEKNMDDYFIKKSGAFKKSTIEKKLNAKKNEKWKMKEDAKHLVISKKSTCFSSIYFIFPIVLSSLVIFLAYATS